MSFAATDYPSGALTGSGIRSGRSQITLVATVALMLLRPGKMLSKIACFAASIGMSMLTQKATSALPHPVNAAT
ncbi:hypothetical protein [Escherichia coli]|uniref:hypothetical protein n=1 Tax=Escherichia coli TaxID=562 RepID=UPI0006A57837|nr:hypothetical protein [Escherichia coli]